MSPVPWLLFSQNSGDSQWWLFCSWVTILMWLWEEASTVSIYCATLTGSPQTNFLKKLKYRWHAILYLFQVYTVVIRYLYILWCDHHSKSINHLLWCKVIMLLLTIFSFTSFHQSKAELSFLPQIHTFSSLPYLSGTPLQQCSWAWNSEIIWVFALYNSPYQVHQQAQFY